MNISQPEGGENGESIVVVNQWLPDEPSIFPGSIGYPEPVLVLSHRIGCDRRCHRNIHDIQDSASRSSCCLLHLTAPRSAEATSEIKSETPP
jgi:hypothetical protein